MSALEPTLPRDESTPNTIIYVNYVGDSEEKSPTIIPPFEELNNEDLTNGEDHDNNIVSTSNEIESPLETEFSNKQIIFTDTQQDNEKFRYNNAFYLGE